MANGMHNRMARGLGGIVGQQGMGMQQAMPKAPTAPTLPQSGGSMPSIPQNPAMPRQGVMGQTGTPFRMPSGPSAMSVAAGPKVPAMTAQTYNRDGTQTGTGSAMTQLDYSKQRQAVANEAKAIMAQNGSLTPEQEAGFAARDAQIATMARGGTPVPQATTQPTPQTSQVQQQLAQIAPQVKFEAIKSEIQQLAASQGGTLTPEQEARLMPMYQSAYQAWRGTL